MVLKHFKLGVNRADSRCQFPKGWRGRRRVRDTDLPALSNGHSGSEYTRLMRALEGFTESHFVS